MPKLKGPLFSLNAKGRLSKLFSLVRRQGQNIIERRPIPVDAESPAQLFNRHMFSKCVDLWHLLSEAEKQEWESAARPRHMTGYAWYISQCLRPNPGIYLPLQGGVMQGIIDMDGFAIQDMLDPVNPQDADTEAARDAAIAAAIAGSLHCDIYAWDGSNWQELRVESAAQHNLRVRLYSGGTPIATGVGGTNIAGSMTSFVSAAVQGWSTVAGEVRGCGADWPADDMTNSREALIVMSRLQVYDGVEWDRVRGWETGVLMIGRGDIGLSDLRRVNAGQVKAGPGSLYWMTMNPTAANSVIELTDDLNGLGAIRWDMTHGVNAAHHMNLDPPIKFLNGIYLKTLTNFTSVIFGYK